MKDRIKKYMYIEIAVIVVFLIVDFLTKKYAEANFVNRHFNVIPYLFNVTYHQNRGAAFGMLQGRQIFFYIITAIMIPALSYFMYLTRHEKLLHKIALALIISGALGNAVDRIFYGYVIDWIEFAFIQFPIFNIADSALTIGTVLMAIYYLFVYKEPQKKQSKDCCDQSFQEGDSGQPSSGQEHLGGGGYSEQTEPAVTQTESIATRKETDTSGGDTL